MDIVVTTGGTSPSLLPLSASPPSEISLPTGLFDELLAALIGGAASPGSALEVDPAPPSEYGSGTGLAGADETPRKQGVDELGQTAAMEPLVALMQWWQALSGQAPAPADASAQPASGTGLESVPAPSPAPTELTGAPTGAVPAPVASSLAFAPVVAGLEPKDKPTENAKTDPEPKSPVSASAPKMNPLPAGKAGTLDAPAHAASSPSRPAQETTTAPQSLEGISVTPASRSVESGRPKVDSALSASTEALKPSSTNPGLSEPADPPVPSKGLPTPSSSGEAATPLASTSVGTPTGYITEAPVSDQSPMPTVSADGPAQMAKHIVGQVRLLEKDGVSRAEMQLHPEQLGRVSVTVQAQEGRVSISLTTENPAAHRLLQERLPELVAALSASGMSLSQADVALHDESRQRGALPNRNGRQSRREGEETGAVSGIALSGRVPLTMLDISA